MLYVDIGSAGGINPLFIESIEKAKFIAVDPLGQDSPKSLRAIKESGSSQLIVENLIWDKTEMVPFHICRKREVSSIFAPNRKFIDKFQHSERFDVVDTIMLQANTIDNLVKDPIDYLKIDIQGASFEALNGARNQLIENVPMLEIELEFEEVYENQKLIADTLKLLRIYDYNILHMELHHWAKKLQYFQNSDVGSTLVWAQVFLGASPHTLKSRGVDLEIRKKIAHTLKFYSYEDDFNL
jgi:FkbM family methyltransferase